MARKENSKLREMIKEYGIKDMNDVHEFVKMLTAETIQAALDAELENELGYSKYDYKNKQTENSRNGYSTKTVQGSMGEVELQIPRDRQGEFEPQIVKKHQTDVSGIEDKIIFLYSQGVSTRDIQKTMREMYGIDVDDSRVSKITDKILPLINEWQERPLQSVYAMVILDAVHYNVRESGIVTKKAAYVAIGTDLEGRKDVLGIWLGTSESSKYWLSVLNGLKSRGVQDILIASIDGLSGFVEAINAAFPKAEVQRCIIHQIRSSTRYISYKDLKHFTSDLKPIYKASTEEIALSSLKLLEEQWGKKYPLAVKSWYANWNELSTMFKYPPEIRTLIYTTNAIENFNRQLRKVTKTKSAFVSDEALMKILYIATMSIVEKWTMPIKNWGSILDNLMIYFGDRVKVQF
ncbi:MAG TPA: IS256 family transposase [Paludibacteraceae bacterium]|nr:IS256 family transposase [Paludibacteraceae bacterium]